MSPRKTAPAPAAPMLSIKERDRRWASLRALMAERELDALMVFGWGRNALDQYLTNEQQGAIVLMAADDEPTMMVGDVPLQRYDTPGAAYERWVSDVRTGDPVHSLIEEVRRHGLRRGRIGVVGLSSRMVGEWGGYVPHSIWTRIRKAVPRATFVDVAEPFEVLVMLKSEEELAMVREAAAIGEIACGAFVEAAAPGVRESAVVAAAMSAIVANGGWMAWPWILERSGTDRIAWDRPEWMSMGGGSRVLQRGDTVSAELFAFYGGFESQQQIDVSLGEPDAGLRRLEQICLESYRLGIDALRPGMRFAELCEVMHEPLHRSKTWNTGPLVQTIGPVIYNGATRVGAEHDPALGRLPELPLGVGLDGDFTITEGVVLAFEPNAVHDGQRVCIGGTVVLGAQGVEELNTLPNRLVVKV